MSFEAHRLNKLSAAAAVGRESLASIHREIATEIIAPAQLEFDDQVRSSRHIDYASYSDYEAVEHIARCVGLAVYDDAYRVDLRTCSARMFRQLWALRQFADASGISYGTYIQLAVKCLYGDGKKRLDLAKLASRSLMLRVMDRYRSQGN